MLLWWFKFSGQTKEVPQGFKDWVDKNAERIKGAEERGKLPYFLRDNKKYFDVKKEIIKKGEIGGKELTKILKYNENGLPTLSDAQTSNIEDICNILNIDKRGKTMSIRSADSGSVNPNYLTSSAYNDNCQSCVYAYELRRRGLNVRATKFVNDKNHITYKVGADTRLPWLTNEGKLPINKKINVNKSSKDEILTLIDNEIKEPGRYIVGCNIGQEGHVLVIEKLSDVNILYYDPQKNKFFDKLPNLFALDSVEIMRVDNVLINKNYVQNLIEVI